MADGMSYPRAGIIGKNIELEDKMEFLINWLRKKEGIEPVVWVAVKIYDDINSSITFYCTGSNDFLVAFKKILEIDRTFPIKETVNESHVWLWF